MYDVSYIYQYCEAHDLDKMINNFKKKDEKFNLDIVDVF